jgi:methionyl-tRNA synthetase
MAIDPKHGASPKTPNSSLNHTNIEGMTNILVPVAWPYANGPRHIGHVAGFGIPSDVFARYMRMKGHNVLMISGTDEHGTPILVQSEEEGVQPQELADRYNRVIAEDLVSLGLSYDLFTRTTTRNHHKVVQQMFTAIYENGYMIKKTTQSAVSPSTGRTLPDRYIEGTCPICGYEQARGDQCDNCGNQLDPIDLINPKSKINGETPKFVNTEHFFLDLPAMATELEKWLDTREGWRPNVIKFSKNLLKDMEARAMTRDIDWGIRIPLEDWYDLPNKRLYVWFDAVIGYLSASIEWARRTGDSDAWRLWWNNPESKSYYFMGKDNITFHSQIWPAELLAHNGKGDKGGKPSELGELTLPTEVVSSEFLTMEGKQFSSSRGVVIYVRDILERYQADALRYYIAIAGPEMHDSNFTWEDFYRRTNEELIAGWGNLVNRVLSMAYKNFGEIPAAGSELTDLERDLLESVQGGFSEVGALIEAHHQKDAIKTIMSLVQEVNKYITVTEPWTLKDESTKARLAVILNTAIQCIKDLNTMLSPFLVYTSEAVYKALGETGTLAPLPTLKDVHDLDDNSFEYPIITGDYALGENLQKWESAPIKVGTQLSKPKPLFVKLDKANIETEIERLKGE